MDYYGIITAISRPPHLWWSSANALTFAVSPYLELAAKMINLTWKTLQDLPPCLTKKNEWGQSWQGQRGIWNNLNDLVSLVLGTLEISILSWIYHSRDANVKAKLTFIALGKNKCCTILSGQKHDIPSGRFIAKNPWIGNFSLGRNTLQRICCKAKRIHRFFVNL